MTTRQKILKAIYPAFMWLTKKKSVMESPPLKNAAPPVSFFELKTTSINGEEFKFEKLKGKKILIVNTASDCGYTGQYSELQKLSDEYRNELVVIGFPSNDFKEQEKGSDEEIASFCKKNYGVDFPLMTKSSVIKGAEQNPVFKWLSDASLNGWNNQEPVWNFSKYLVDEEGRLLNYFAPSVSPLDKVITGAIRK